MISKRRPESPLVSKRAEYNGSDSSATNPMKLLSLRRMEL
jgi:hypothetical protein